MNRFSLLLPCVLVGVFSGWFSPTAKAEAQVFVGSGESGVYACRFSGGELGEARRVFPLEEACSLELGPRGEVLYVSTGSGSAVDGVGEVIALRVLEGGVLEELNRVAFDAERFCSLAVSPDRRVLLGASYGSGVVASFRLGEDGSIGAQVSHHALPRFPRGKKELARAHDVEFTRDASLAFVPDIANDRVYTFAVGEDGGLERRRFVTSDSFHGPRHLVLNSESSRLYVLNQMGSSVVGFEHDQRGQLTEFQNLSAIPADYDGPQNHSAEILIHPNGEYLYASNRIHDSLSVFRIDAAGRLAASQRVPSGGVRPWSFVFGAGGRFLICSNRKSNHLVVFEIDVTTGDLQRHGAEVSVPDPISMAIRAGGAEGN